MIDIENIVQQVLHNCLISDSRYAGVYSVCGLALRLRDLYKWEMGLEPWVEKDPDEVLTWIGIKEEAWDNLAHKDFKALQILNKRFDPFDISGYVAEGDTSARIHLETPNEIFNLVYVFVCVSTVPDAGEGQSVLGVISYSY